MTGMPTSGIRYTHNRNPDFRGLKRAVDSRGYIAKMGHSLDERLRRRYFAGFALSMLGTGLWLPLNAIYLNDERNFSPSLVGVYYVVVAAASIAVNLTAGPVADRLGPFRPFLAGGMLQCVGILLLLAAPSRPLIFVAAALCGMGNGAFYAVQTAVLSRLFGADGLSRVFGRQYQIMNVGIGVGALAVGALVSTIGHLAYVIGFSVNAVSYAAHALNVAGPVRKMAQASAGETVGVGGGVRTNSAESGAPGRGGPFRPYGDRKFITVILVQLCLALFGFAQFEAVVPIVFKKSAELPLWSVTAFLAVNCVAVVAVQGRATRCVEERGHRAGLRYAMMSWITAAAAGAAAGLMGPLVLRIGAVFVFALFFAVGETLISPSMHPLAVALAPKNLVTTYTAAVSMVYNLGVLIGPFLLLPLFGRLGSTPYWCTVALGSVLGVALLGRVGGSRQETAAPHVAEGVSP